MLKQILDNFGVAATTSVNQRRAALGTSLVHVRTAAGHQSFHHFKVPLYRNTIERR